MSESPRSALPCSESESPRKGAGRARAGRARAGRAGPGPGRGSKVLGPVPPASSLRPRDVVQAGAGRGLSGPSCEDRSKREREREREEKRDLGGVLAGPAEAAGAVVDEALDVGLAELEGLRRPVREREKRE